MATSRKTLQLDLLQLNALNFKTTSNTNIPSSFVLYANGNGTTSFASISSLTTLGYNSISVPGQATLYSPSTNGSLNLSSLTSDIYISTVQSNSLIWIGLPNITSTIVSTVSTVLDVVLPSTCFGLSNNYQSLISGSSNYITNTTIPNTMASTMSNILTYPNIYSTIQYGGSSGLNVMSKIGTSTIAASGTGYFSSLQYNFTYFTKYINPNGSSRLFLEYNPSFTFSQVSAPSSISSVSLYPEGNSSIVNLLSISSHILCDMSGIITPVIGSGVQQYIPVTSFQPLGFSTNTRTLSNSFMNPMRMEISSGLLLSPNLRTTTFSVQHYLSSAIAYKITTPSINISRTGLENSTVQINNSIGDDNNVFIKIYNSGNKF